MNFALILFLLTIATGAVWLFDLLVMKKRRAVDAREPWWVEYGASFFPVILVVFLLRSFLVEPFKIPSGSMIPTLLVGDFILVNKYTYGIRLPVLNKKILDMGEPQRGDVMVFRYPEDPSLDYIKRVVGLPGDKVAYQNKRLFINGAEIQAAKAADYLHPDRLYYSARYVEKLGGAEHAIIVDNDAPAFVSQAMPFPHRDNCIYNSAGVVCEVPPGHYFVMGDNRDASSDSRVWGFVPEQNIVGKAFLIWFNFGDLRRIGGFK
ncbi:MAG: signal peptidase I [Rhodocyclales bacterium]|nr:signal peptidase I [Rhodocyclales bacterium]